MTQVTPELIQQAYVALASEDREQAVKYWAEDIRFLVAGHHAQAGWRVGLDDFLDLRRALVRASGGTFVAELLHTMIDGDHSMDTFRLSGRRLGADPDSTSPFDVLDAHGMQLFRWSGGRIVEGRTGFFGDGATNYNQWWAPIGPDGRRR
jgi:hypothetical protein